MTVVRAVRYQNTEGSKDCFLADMSEGVDEDWDGLGGERDVFQA